MPTNLPKEAVSTDKTHRTIGGLLLLFVLSALLLLGMQGITLYDRFARSAEVGLDNRVWLFAQLEVEAKNFSLAMLEGMAEGGGRTARPGTRSLDPFVLRHLLQPDENGSCRCQGQFPGPCAARPVRASFREKQGLRREA